jgi:membrane protein DedA with SNARE-associated domain
VRSVTLLASIGVEELELLGDHTLNHGLHGLQLAALEAARWVVPHFGALDRGMLTRAYARNFFDTDQRRLRPILEELAAPTLIVHGEDDFLVPVAAAREHARIVPQAELLVLPSPRGHFLPWTEALRVAAATEAFLQRVDRGEAPPRAAAKPARAAAAARPFDPADVPPFEGPAWLAVLLLLALGTLVSEDLSCIAAGLLVADGRLGIGSAAAACFAGILAGDLALFALGRVLGRPALGAPPLRWVVTEAAVERASRWFERKGLGVIFLSRFTPGLRLPTYVAAGLLHTPWLTFAGFFAVAGLLWTPLLVGTAALAGEQLAARLGSLGAAELPWIAALALLLLQAYRTLPLTLTHRGRRRLRGRWLRLTRWEFWPPWLTYPPVLLWIAWLALRHRSLSVVTAANPGIPASGVVGESKAAILEDLDPDAPEVAGHVLLRAGDGPEARARAAEAFLERFGADYPVVVKPDAGQRGSGVRMAPDRETLVEWARSAPHDLIVQERVDGEEFGVFYARRPSEERGRVLGVTVKVLPEVVGDGRRTVEELLLDDDRACAMHGAYLEELGPRAEDVPAPGERVPLVRVGTHARGAVFLDGAALVTPALEASVERIARRFEGFHLGRFDVRAPSAQALSRGEGLRVLELNGLTSEPTEIYDPAVSLAVAYGKLLRQWTLAFEIGAENARGGAPTTTLLQVLQEWVRYRRAQRGHGRGQGGRG